ncbi:MAG: glycosyltransferase family 4 protein [Pseudomonadota bacterium]
MNICLISTGYPPEDGGGIGTYIYNLSHGLSALGHYVHVVTKTTEKKYNCEKIGKIIIHRLPEKLFLRGIERFLPGINWSYNVYKLVKQLDQQSKIDIIEFPNWESPGIVSQLLLRRIPIVVRIHTPLFETLELDKKNEKINLTEKIACYLEKVSCTRAKYIISSTKFHANMLAAKYSLKINEINILPLGIMEKKEAQEKDIKSQNKFKILYVSRLEHRKGTLTLINSLPSILKNRKDILIDFVGSDRKHAPGNMKFEKYFINNYGVLKDQVFFHGFVTDKELQDFYKQADLFVVPSVYESFGLIYIEAMSYSLPSIATTGGGIPEVIEHGENGYLIEPHDTKALVYYINKIYSDDNLKKKLSRQSKKTYTEKFRYMEMSQKTEFLYKKAINDG